MNSVLHWLRDHKIVAVFIAGVYSAITTLSHDLVQAPALAVQEIVGMAVWHYTILGIIIVGLFGIITSIVRTEGIQDRLTDNRIPIFVLVGLTLLASSLLMVNSVEHIHMLQYTVMVFLLIPVFGNSFAAMMVAMLLGAVDESYQFFGLHDWQGYLDFNDIVLNSIGAAWGVALFEVFYSRTGDDIEFLGAQKRLLPTIAWCSFFVLIIALVMTGVIGLFQDEGLVILSRYTKPELFGPLDRWIDTEWGNHWYKLTPIEGLITAFLLPLTAMRKVVGRP